MVTREQVRETLSRVLDPELGLSIVDLGLIYEIRVTEGEIRVVMTMTTPGCPIQETLTGNIRTILGAMDPGKKIEVTVVWDPPWTPQRISPRLRPFLGLRYDGG